MASSGEEAIEKAQKERPDLVRSIRNFFVRGEVMNETTLADLLSSLDMTVMKRLDEGSFRLMGTIPDWFKRLYPEAVPGKKGFRPEKGLPFLENFLVDAEHFWTDETSGRLNSGPWIETDPSGNDYALEATAVSMGKTKILLIELGPYSYGEKQFLIQKGRELGLDYRHLQRLEEELLRAKQAAEAYAKELKNALEVSESLRVEMEEAKSQADYANRAKSDFLASMSHEIRTPLTAVLGMADLLSATQLTIEQKRSVETIRGAGENLLQVINDILDLSKIEARQIEIEKTPFNLMKVFNNTCVTQAFRAHEKSLELVRWIRPEVETHLIGDPIRLGQILSNLIGNAIKFTKKGEVFVEVRRHEVPGQAAEQEVTDSSPKQDAGRTIELLFSVTDTGIGIPPEKTKAIFDRFTQADSSTTREYGGTGLGLSISHQLVELMGGRIWLESKAGQGSTFYFTARFEVQTGEVSFETPDVDMKSVRILIIDDNVTNRMVLSEMVSQWGAQVTVKEDGEQGLDELRRAKDAGDPYDLVLLDCRMPRMDGFEVAERIKEDSLLSGPVIIMLTSADRKAGIERSKELGIAHHLLKPIKWSDLKETAIASLEQKEAAAEERPEVLKRVAQEDRKPFRILLVEDNEKNRFLIRTILKNTPYTLDMAENGEIAVQKFKADQYDLVLMDIEMPVMDGYTATRDIRKWEAENRVEPTPIIALTAHALREHIRKNLEAGWTDHVTKPFKMADLLAAIERYAHKGKSQERPRTEQNSIDKSNLAK